MADAGYYRTPTLHGDTVVFVCEDDLWAVSAAGGVARRLTANPGRAASPALSPDGTRLAFAGRDEGNSEVYLMAAAGGEATRLTHLGANSAVVGWTPQGHILFVSDAAQPLRGMVALYTLEPQGGDPVRLPVGPAMSLSYGPQGGRVLGRNTNDIARWKRYRGGLTGELWIDPTGDGAWRKLIALTGNVARPLWLGERIYFVSDHEGTGNLYSCTPTGEELTRHSQHSDYYVRHPASDGKRIVYGAGADLYLFDPQGGSRKLDITLLSPRSGRKRKFVEADKHLQGYHLHPEGKGVAVVTRGKTFSMGTWDGAAVQHGDPVARTRLAAYLPGGQRLVTVSDAGGEEGLELHATDARTPPERLEGLDIGRPVALLPSPTADTVAIANHRNELLLVDITARSATRLDQSAHGIVQGMAWSADGHYLAYGFRTSQQTCALKLYDRDTKRSHPLTEPVLWDATPAFDPGGKYLYFLSARDFNPVYDALHFDLGFPKGIRPHLITLQQDTPSPFSGPREAKAEADKEAAKPGEGKTPEPVRIDLEDITARVVAFPMPEGRYGRIAGLDGKVLVSSYPVEGALDGASWFEGGTPPAKGKLECYDLAERSSEVLVEGMTDFTLSADAKTLLYRAGNRLRILTAGEKPKDDKNGESGKKSGWLNLSRVRVPVIPALEWRQMLAEAWRLQRDYFWTADMSGIDWQGVYNRYLPLLDRVATRSEFSDLMWEMQGELGTSHAYEMGGDYRPEPHYPQGFLAADLRYGAEAEGYVVEHIVQGDGWNEAASSPLARPGVNVKPGDRLVAINGVPLDRDTPPQTLLVDQAEREVLLGVVPAAGGEARTVTVKTLRDERPARYREWVEHNRRAVHEATGGRAGYVHIPDMGPPGYAEFHRGYLSEVGKDALIVDVRYNGGGHVSQLLLEKLARKRLGYDIQRWGEPLPFPQESLLGPIVALTNEQAGSDGDIFCHTFKLMGLGPLIGKRTWGGVIGVNLTGRLADGGIVTQPQYAFWFNDVGWQVENYGTEPTITVEYPPHDYTAGRDPQLARGIAEVLAQLTATPPVKPDFGDRPRLAPPPLPNTPKET